MCAVRARAAHAVLLARELLARLRDADFDAYVAASPEYEKLCTALLHQPLDEFDGEAGALLKELARLQRELCGAIDVLLEDASINARNLRAARQAALAYHATNAGSPGRSHVA